MFPMNASNFHDFLGQTPEPLHPKSWRTVCRAHKLARRTPAESHQNSLLRWIRPPTWCATDAFAACLDDDSRGLIVQLLLSLRMRSRLPQLHLIKSLRMRRRMRIPNPFPKLHMLLQLRRLNLHPGAPTIAGLLSEWVSYSRTQLAPTAESQPSTVHAKE